MRGLVGHGVGVFQEGGVFLFEGVEAAEAEGAHEEEVAE